MSRRSPGCGTPPARRRHRRRWSPSSSFAAPRRCCRAVIATRIWCRRRWSRHCCAPERWPRRQPVPKRCSPGSTPPRWTPRCALRLLPRWLCRTAPPSSSPWRRPAWPIRPADQVLMLVQQSWALVYTGDPRAGESAASRALVIAEQGGDAAMMVWALTALMVAVVRQGRYGEALARARRAAALAADSHDMRSLPLQPKFFLGLALFDCDLVGEARAAYREALDDEFGSGWFLSETLTNDAQAAFAVGEWADAVPGLIAGGQAAQEKGNQILVSQSLAYRAIIATATGDHRAAGELAAGIAGSLEGDQLSYNAGVLAFAVAGVKAAEGDRQGAYDLLLRCWLFDAARECRFYHRALAPDLVRLALALGHR